MFNHVNPLVLLFSISIMLVSWSALAETPTEAQCQDAMSYVGFNIAAVAECKGEVKQSDLPDYSGAIADCNLAYGEGFVTEATKTGIRDFKYKLQDHGRKNLCPAIKQAPDNY